MLYARNNSFSAFSPSKLLRRSAIICSAELNNAVCRRCGQILHRSSFQEFTLSRLPERSSSRPSSLAVDAPLVTRLWFSYLSDLLSTDISSSFGSRRNPVVLSAVTENRPKPCFTITAVTKLKISPFSAP